VYDVVNAATSQSERPRTRALKKEDCVICLDRVTNGRRLECGHEFCSGCIDAYFERGQPKCPSCGRLFGMLRGNQPPGGKMTVKTHQRMRLAGYERYGTIEISYYIPDGVQTVCGKYFVGRES